MSNSLKGLQLIDWDFPRNSSNVLMHDLCWYPARFVPAIPAHLIEALASSGDTVVDPFCGSGTTVIEAMLLGCKAVGFDINPFAILIAQAKCLILTKPSLLYLPELKRLLGEVSILSQIADATNGDCQADASRKRGRPIQSELFVGAGARAKEEAGDRCRILGVNSVANADWYHPSTLRQLEHLFCSVEKIENSNLQHILETVFIAILMPASGHRGGKPYGYYADNVVPRDKLYRNAFKMFSSRLLRLVARCSVLSQRAQPAIATPSNVEVADACDEYSWKGLKFNCVVTSPPYPGAVDYTNAFRLASYWFPKLSALDRIRQNEIGARSLRKSSDARKTYFARMHQVFGHMVHGLAPGGSLAIVLPRGKAHGRTNETLVEDLLSSGELRLVGTVERRILNRYFVRKGGGIQKETVSVFRKQRR